MVVLNWPVLVGAAVVDSFNPCAFGVLIFLLAYLMKIARKKSRMILTHGIVYIIAVFITYLVAGLVLLPVIREIGALSVAAYLVVGALIILAGIIELKDFFYYGRGFSLTIAPGAAKRIKMYVKHVSERISTAFFLGVFVAIVELPCTGAVYVAVLFLMSLVGVTASNVAMLLTYNILFVLPLMIILLLFYAGVSAKKFEQWHQRHKALMRLVTGFTLIGLGGWMLLSAV